MTKYIFVFVVLFVHNLYANLNIVVSIVPQKSLVEAIGGRYVTATVMVKPGSSPHTYEPKPSQMKDISNADLYFSIGVEFEQSWLNKFKNQNKNLIIYDMGKNVTKINHNPHIWTTPQNIKILSKNILDILVLKDIKHKDSFVVNYKKLVLKLDKLDSTIKDILKQTKKGAKFMVFHPAWGYFAKQYGLVQLPIEIDGKEPKPKAIIKLINIAKKQNIKAIFTQPEFSKKVATTIANQLGIKVIQTSPMNPKWDENLIKLSKAIAGIAK